jgi:mono/diheme cytochrome c family protein
MTLMRNLIWMPFVAFVLASCGDSSSTQGERLYNVYCANCHLDDGQGLRGLMPPLAGSDYLRANFDDLPCIIRNGIRGPLTVNGKVYNENMGGFPKLTEAEIANIVNYISQKWGDKDAYISEREVREVLLTCE